MLISGQVLFCIQILWWILGKKKNQKKLDLYYLKVITLYSLKEIKYIKY